MRHDECFHALHAQGVLMLPNCWDGGSARLAAAAGAPALATSSAALAWSHGYPDGSRLPTELLLASARAIARVGSLPLTMDIEDGYSDDPDQVASLVVALLEAGVVGINIEDGAADVALLCEKIAAVRARAEAVGVRLYINARTDVYLRGLAPPAEQVPETLRRARLVRAAGASGLFVPGLRDEAQIAAVAAGAALPLNLMALPGLAAPARLAALGVRRLSAGSAIGEAAYGVTGEAMRAFMDSGRVEARSPGYGTLNALMTAST